MRRHVKRITDESSTRGEAIAAAYERLRLPANPSCFRFSSMKSPTTTANVCTFLSYSELSCIARILVANGANGPEDVCALRSTCRFMREWGRVEGSVIVMNPELNATQLAYDGRSVATVDTLVAYTRHLHCLRRYMHSEHSSTHVASLRGIARALAPRHWLEVVQFVYRIPGALQQSLFNVPPYTIIDGPATLRAIVATFSLSYLCLKLVENMAFELGPESIDDMATVLARVRIGALGPTSHKTFREKVLRLDAISPNNELDAHYFHRSGLHVFGPSLRLLNGSPSFLETVSWEEILYVLIKSPRETHMLDWHILKWVPLSKLQELRIAMSLLAADPQWNADPTQFLCNTDSADAVIAAIVLSANRPEVYDSIREWGAWMHAGDDTTALLLWFLARGSTSKGPTRADILRIGDRNECLIQWRNVTDFSVVSDDALVQTLISKHKDPHFLEHPLLQRVSVELRHFALNHVGSAADVFNLLTDVDLMQRRNASWNIVVNRNPSYAELLGKYCNRRMSPRTMAQSA